MQTSEMLLGAADAADAGKCSQGSWFEAIGQAAADGTLVFMIWTRFIMFFEPFIHFLDFIFGKNEFHFCLLCSSSSSRLHLSTAIGSQG